MMYLWMALIGLHVLFATIWLGGNAVMSMLVGPALAAASPSAMGEVAGRLGASAGRFFRAVGMLTIALGMAIGVHLGALTSWQALFGSFYGWTYLAALLLALGIFAFGEFVVGRRAKEIAQASPADRPRAIRRMIHAASLEKVGFLAILGCMVLLRFGL